MGKKGNKELKEKERVRKVIKGLREKGEQKGYKE